MTILNNPQFNFDAFYKKYSELYPSMSLPSKSFLEWLIGFAEGDGSLIVAKRGDLSFVLTQSTIDVQILSFIKNTLGFGSVIVQSKVQQTHRFIVQDLKNLELICLLFNGNRVFPVGNTKFLIFLSNLNLKLAKNNLPTILPISTTILPTLKDSWLTGFTDAEGCFSVSLLGNSNAFRIRFILTQKWEANKFVLSHILELFQSTAVVQKEIGAIVPHSVSDVFELRINGVKNCEYIFAYFDEYKLITLKSESYEKWKLAHAQLKNQDHLIPELWEKLTELAKTINSRKRKD